MRNNFVYFGLCLGIYLSLAVIEIFIFEALINMITTHFFYKVIIYSVIFLLINPFLTKFLTDKYKFSIKSDDK